MRNVLRRALPACSRTVESWIPWKNPKSPGSLEKGFQKLETFVCFRLKGEAACGAEVKDLYLENRFLSFFLSFFYPCCLFSSEFILLGGFKGAERYEGELVQLETETSLSVSNFAKAKGFHLLLTERVTGLEKLQQKHNYTLVLVRGVYLCVSVCTLCFLKLYVYKSPLVS